MEDTTRSCPENGEFLHMSSNDSKESLLTPDRHLGMTKEIAPCPRGFDKNFSLLPGAGNHYNYEPQLDDIEVRFIHTTGFCMEGDKFFDRTTEIPEDFYLTPTFTDKMLEFLENRTGKESQKSFFVYMRYTAPRWPLQTPREIIEKYGWSSTCIDCSITDWAQRECTTMVPTH